MASLVGAVGYLHGDQNTEIDVLHKKESFPNCVHLINPERNERMMHVLNQNGSRILEL